MYFSNPNATQIPFAPGSHVVHYRDIENVGVIVAAAPAGASDDRCWLIEGADFDVESAYSEDCLLHADAPRVKCGCCKGFHPSAQGVRDCHWDAAECADIAASERLCWPYI